MAKESCHNALHESIDNDSHEFSQDSRWSSPRHGKENTNVMMDVHSPKIVSFYDSVKGRKNLEENCSGPSNMMESNRLHHIASEMNEAYGDDELHIAHDVRYQIC